MKTTTLNEIRKCNLSKSSWEKLLNSLGKTQADDEPLSFIKILDSNGIADAIWCLLVLPDYDLEVMKLKLKCARRVEHLDNTGTAKATLNMVERFINGAASKEELKAASADAADAADAAYAAADAAYAAAATAAYAVAVADAASASAAAADAASDAASAAYAAYAATDAATAAAAAAADAAASDAAYAAEREYQAKIFREIFG